MKSIKRISFVIIGSAALLLILLVSIDPNNLPAFILVVPFVLIFVLLFSTAVFLLEKKGVQLPHRLRIAALFSAFPVLLLVLQSIGQLTVRDVLAVIVLFALSYFYVLRMPASS